MKKNSDDIIDIEKTQFVVIIDADEYSDYAVIYTDIKIIRAKFVDSKVIICAGNSVFPEKDIRDVKIITYDDVTLFGKLHSSVVNEITSYESYVLLALNPLKSKLSKLVASKFETSLLVTVCDDCNSEQYDLVIKEDSRDTKKKIETIVFYLKQLNIKR